MSENIIPPAVAQIEAGEAIRTAQLKVDDAHKDIRWIGPDLRNIREKLRPDWIKQWLLDPHAFAEKRPPRWKGR